MNDLSTPLPFPPRTAAVRIGFAIRVHRPAAARPLRAGPRLVLVTRRGPGFGGPRRAAARAGR